MESLVSLALLPSPEVTTHQVAETDLRDAVHPVPADHVGEVLSRVKPDPVEYRRHVSDIVDEWGMQSFPASDPPANW